ncbi:MAG: COX15/CtaA family protein, partial [Acidimicrobiales bacterium]
LLLLETAVVVVLGTVVTSTGPHGGSPGAKRLHLSLHDVAQLHGAAVELLVLLTLVTLWWLARSGAPRSVMRRGTILLVAMVAQGAVGYAQYFTGDPAGAVAIHIAGAVVVIVAVLRFYFGLTGRAVEGPTGPAPRPAALVA